MTSSVPESLKTRSTYSPDTIHSESIEGTKREVVRLVIALQGSDSGEIVYEFHPLWEADK